MITIIYTFTYILVLAQLMSIEVCNWLFLKKGGRGIKLKVIENISQ